MSLRMVLKIPGGNPWGMRVYVYCLPLYLNAKMGYNLGCKRRQENALARSMTVNHWCSGVSGPNVVAGLGTGWGDSLTRVLMALRSCAIL